MINYKKEKLIKKHLGVNTEQWVINNCISMLTEFHDMLIEKQEKVTEKKYSCSTCSGSRWIEEKRIGFDSIMERCPNC